MTEENALIQAILADPGDVAHRLVYADWLEDHGAAPFVHRAAYLRAECELDSLPPRDRRRRQLRDRLLQLRKLVGDDWWQQLDWAKVEYCVEFTYRCSQRWDTLTPTDDADVRHCSECQQQVHYCHSAREAELRADAGQCVAIDSRLARLPLTLLRAREEAGRLLGRVAPQVLVRLPLQQRGRKPEEE